MTTLTDRIAAVLREHYYLATMEGPRCLCGIACSIDDHPAHVAEVIEAAMHLSYQVLVKTDETPPLYAISGWMRP
jgi:hypothetical protein